MNSSLENTIREIDCIQWIGILQPAYKITPQLASSDTPTKVIISVLNHDASLATLDHMNTLMPVLATSYDEHLDQYYVTTSVDHAIMNEIARLPNVIYL